MPPPSLSLFPILSSSPLRPLALISFAFFPPQANLGCADLLLECLVKREGLSREQALSKIWLMDRAGVLLRDRDRLDPQQARFAQPPLRLQKLLEERVGARRGEGGERGGLGGEAWNTEA
jgi:hypothetical protein